MMKRNGFRCGFGSILVSGAIYMSAMAAPAQAIEPRDDSSTRGDYELSEVCSQDDGSVPASGVAAAETGLWPAVHYPEQSKVMKPEFAELSQPTGPTRLEYRLWPVIDFEKEVPITKPWTLQLAQNASGPARAEHRLWPTTYAPVAHEAIYIAQRAEQGAGSTRAFADGAACIVSSEQYVVASR